MNSSGSITPFLIVWVTPPPAKKALEEKRKQLELSGLEGWCCAFRSKGVSLNL